MYAFKNVFGLDSEVFTKKITLYIDINVILTVRERVVAIGFSYRFNTNLVLGTSLVSKSHVQVSNNHKKLHTYQFQFASLVIKIH